MRRLLVEQRGRRRLVERRQHPLRQVEPRPVVADRCDERHALALQPPRGEGERGERRRIQPLGVVDQHGRRRRVAQRLQQRGADLEQARRRAVLTAERQRERCRHGARQQQLVQAGEGEPGLGRGTGGPQDGQPVRPRGRVVEQRGLAQPRRAAEHERAAAAVPRVVEKGAQRRLLVLATVQHVPILPHPARRCH